jgi:DNA-binding MarR family transcriptional regulator
LGYAGPGRTDRDPGCAVSPLATRNLRSPISALTPAAYGRMSVYARIMANAEQQVDLARCAEIAETCTNFSLRKVTRMVGAIYDDGLRPSGLKGTQFNQLVALALLRTATVQKLAKILVVDRTSLTRSLVPLERDNLVQSLPSVDGRERKLALTSLGYQRLREATRLWELAQRRVAKALGPTRTRALTESLKGAAEVLGEG